MIEQFIASPELKFAVITKESWQQDEVAQSLSSSPRCFEFDGKEMVIISIPKSNVQALYDYVRGQVEFDWPTVGTGKVTLLLHSQALDLLSGLDNQDDDS